MPPSISAFARSRTLAAAAVFWLFSVISLDASELYLASVFGDGMVLQRETAVPVWGKAPPLHKVTIKFAGQLKTTTSDDQGRWRITLDALAVRREPSVLELQCDDSTITCENILVGDVWLASGQSNMAAPLSSVPDATNVLAEVTDPQLRFFTVTKATGIEPQTSLHGRWESAAPATAGSFSAVAYYFAREIRLKQDVPVAVINASWGGTPVQTWISLEAVRTDPALSKTATEWDQAMAQHQRTASDPSLVAKYKADLKKWQQEVAPVQEQAMKAYNAAIAAGASVGSRPVLSRPEPINPDPMAVPGPSRRPQTPAVSYNAMIAPLIPYALRGVIWYQGEQNNGSGIEYRDLFARLIMDWRSRWAQGDFPFLFVQLPSNGKDVTPVAKGGWPLIREAQLMTLQIPQTGMAVTLDIGNPQDVHPQNKVHVGHRLALAARRVAYGETLVASGPLFDSCWFTSGQAHVRFRETGGGLMPGEAPWHPPGYQPFPQDHLIGFYVAGADREWVEAEAHIEGETVTVWTPLVPAPIAVRYGWAQSPRANLYNREGLPASPFRTDDWP